MWKPWQRFLLGITEIIDGLSAVLSLGLYHSVLSYRLQTKFARGLEASYFDHASIEVKEDKNNE